MLSYQFDGPQSIALQMFDHTKNWNGSSQISSYLLASDPDPVLWSVVLPLGCHNLRGHSKTRNITSTTKVKKLPDSSENHFRKYRILSCCGSIINTFIAYLRKCNLVECKLLKIRGTAWTAYHQRQIALEGSHELSKMLEFHQGHHIFCYLNPDQLWNYFELADNHMCTSSVDRIVGFEGPCQFLA